MLAGPPVQLAAAQTGGGDDDSTPTETPDVRARDAQPSSLIFKVGSDGSAVSDIQRSLGITTDGIFGPDTDRAVRAYQAKQGLSVDGIVGPRTWAALFGGQAAAATPAPKKQSAPAPKQDAKPAAASQRKGGLVFVLDGGKAAERKPAKKRERKKVETFKIRPTRKPQSRKVSRGGGSCSSGTLSSPLKNGTLTSPYGPRGGRLHAGQDIAAPSGTPIRAAACGIVTELGMQGGYGNMVCIKHSSRFTTCYAHMSRFGTSQGARVRAGQVIGFVGCTGSCTGPHVHFETRVNGQGQDPSQYLRRSGGRSYRKAKLSRSATPAYSTSSSQSGSGRQPVAQAGTSGHRSGAGSTYDGSSGGTAYQQAPVEQAPVEQQAPVQQAPVQQAPVEQAPVQQAPVESTTPAPVTESPAGEQGQPSEQPVVETPAVKTPEVPGVTAPSQPGAGAVGTGGGEQGNGEAQQPAETPQAEQPQATQPEAAPPTDQGSTGTGSPGASQGAGTGAPPAPAGQ